DPGAGLGQLLLEPAVERTLEEPARDVVRGDLEGRVDARLDGMLAEEVGTERVDRPDARLLELGERLPEPRPGGLRRRGGLPRLLDPRPETKLHLPRRRLRERHRDHLDE